MIQATPYTHLYPNFAGESLPKWVFSSRATLIGDAAHAHGGAFAAGGSLALDDALALGLSFKHVFQSTDQDWLRIDEIKHAFDIYADTRKPHTDKLLHIVHSQISAKAPAFTTPDEEDRRLVARLKNRPDTEWLSEHDVEAAMGATIQRYEDAGSSGQGQVDSAVQAHASKL